jgi:hypothetical protein
MLHYNQVPKKAHRHKQYIFIKIKIFELVRRWELWGEIKFKKLRVPK